MAVWKRYNGKRVKGEGPKGKGTWIVEFRLRGHYVKQAIPEARTRAEAEQAQTKIKRDIFDDKYNRAAGNKDFGEFVEEVFVPWAKASKRSWQDDEERAKPLKEFFAGKRLRDITPTLIEQYKQQRLKTKTLHKQDRSPATVNRELQVLSKVFSMAYDNGLVDTNPMRRVHKLREAPARSHSSDRRRSFADRNATGRNPGLEVGARRLRSKDDLCRPYKDRTTAANSHEQARRGGTQVVRAGRFVRRACFQLCPHWSEADNLQACVGRSV